MINSKQLKQSFGRPLLDSGYLRKGSNWHKDAGDITLLVNLQKSDYANEYFINLAFNFKELTGLDVVPAHKCHVRLRVKDALLTVSQPIDLLMSPDCPILNADEHENAIEELSTKIARFMEDLSSTERIAAARVEGILEGAAIRKTVLPVLHDAIGD